MGLIYQSTSAISGTMNTEATVFVTYMCKWMKNKYIGSSMGKIYVSQLLVPDIGTVGPKIKKLIYYKDLAHPY